MRAVGAGPGVRLLDVAAGAGNAALKAAAAGAEVVATDLTPELVEVGRAPAAEDGLDMTWDVADAEALPFADGSFDAVVSTFGVMFAPRHEVAAGELVRVLKPGGRLAVASSCRTSGRSSWRARRSSRPAAGTRSSRPSRELAEKHAYPDGDGIAWDNAYLLTTATR